MSILAIEWTCCSTMSVFAFDLLSLGVPELRRFAWTTFWVASHIGSVSLSSDHFSFVNPPRERLYSEISYVWTGHGEVTGLWCWRGSDLTWMDLDNKCLEGIPRPPCQYEL